MNFKSGSLFDRRLLWCAAIFLFFGASVAVSAQDIRIAALKNPDVVDGCTCGFQTAAEARKTDSRKWLFLSELGGGEAFMNIDGRDIKVKLVKTTENTGRRARVGQRFYEQYAAPNIKVRVDYVTKKVCPPLDESCEVIDYEVTITVTRGKSSKTVKAAGSCGC